MYVAKTTNMENILKFVSLIITVAGDGMRIGERGTCMILVRKPE
jgi:hypothetical protein